MKLCELSAGSFLGPYFMYVFISMGYASVAGALVSFVEPLAAGSGIPEIKTYLNGIHIKGLLAVGSIALIVTRTVGQHAPQSVQMLWQCCSHVDN